MVNNSSNSSEQNQENQENQSLNNSTDLNYLKELSKKQARKKLTWDNSWDKINNIEFYNKLNQKKYNEKNLYEDLKRSLEWRDLEKLLSNASDENKKEFFDEFLRESNRLSYKYESIKNEVCELGVKRYELDSISKNNLEKELWKLSYNKLLDLQLKTEEFQKFINSVTKTTKNRKDNFQEIKKVFENITFSSSEEFRQKLKEKLRKNPELWDENSALSELNQIISKIKSWDDLNSIDISTLFDYQIFSNEQKKAFIKVYLPSISLQELIDLSLISESEAQNKKKNELKDFLSKKRWWASISDNDRELLNLIEYVQVWDIYVSSQDYAESWLLNLEKSETLKDRMVKSFNEFKEWVKEDLVKEILTIDILKNKIREDQELSGKINWWVEMLEKIKTGAVLKIDFTDSQDENKNYVDFYEMINFWEDWSFGFIDRSLNWNYNNSNTLQSTNSKYISLFEAIKSKNLKNIEIFSKDDIKDQIKTWKIKQTISDINDPTLWDKEDYLRYLDEEINKMKIWKSEEEIKELEKDPNYQKLLTSKEKFQNIDSLDDDLIKDELMLFILKNQIDELDPSWKEFKIWIWTSFKLDDSSLENPENYVFTIVNIDQSKKMIQMMDATWEVFFASFEQLLWLIKEKSPNLKRFSNTQDLKKLWELFWTEWNLGNFWSKFEFKDWKIISKDTSNTANYEFLVQNNEKWENNKVLKLWKIFWTWASSMVEIQEWIIEDKERKIKKWNKSEKVKDTTYNLWPKELVSVAFLENYIRTKNLKPETLEKVKETSWVKEWEKWKWSFYNRFLWNKSVHEILWWLKMLFTQLKEHLKTWNEEHSARIALATWWKLIPSLEIKTQLLSRVEETQAKSMEGAVSRLKNIDTSDAIALIYNRITYKNTEEYKKEAALVFMLEKYGNLYNKNYEWDPKAPLYSRKWEFLWFKALSWYRWKVEDHPLYKEVKADCEKPNSDWNTRNFTEEELVWILMKKQCKAWGYEWIKRRSRFHKDVEKKKKQWIEDEIKDWQKKWWETRNPSDQLEAWLGELKSWSPANAIWWLSKLVDRWSSMEDMNLIPLIMVYSWIALTLPDKLSNEIKNIVDEWRIIPLARFMSYPKDINLAIKTIRILAHEIEKKSDNYKWIWSEAEELYNDLILWRLGENQRREKCLKFFTKKWKNWKTFWHILTKVMYMSADWDSSEDWELSSILLTEKDKPWNETLKQFYANQSAYLVKLSKKDDYLSDAFAGKWTFSLSPWIIKAVFDLDDDGFKMPESANEMVSEIQKEIEAIKARPYKNPNDQKIRLKHCLKNIFAWVLWISVVNTELSKNLFKWVGVLKFFNEKRWVNLDYFVEANLSKDDVAWNHPKSQEILDIFVENILNDKWGKNLSQVRQDSKKSAIELLWNTEFKK